MQSEEQQQIFVSSVERAKIEQIKAEREIQLKRDAEIQTKAAQVTKLLEKQQIPEHLLNERACAYLQSRADFLKLLEVLNKWLATYSSEACGDDIDDLPMQELQIYGGAAAKTGGKVPTKLDYEPVKDEEFKKIGMVDSPASWTRESIFYVIVKKELSPTEDEDEQTPFEKTILHLYPSHIFVYVCRR